MRAVFYCELYVIHPYARLLVEWPWQQGEHACYLTKLYGLSFLQCSFPRLAICPLPQTICPFIFKRCLGGGGGDEKLVMFAMVIAQLPPSLCSSCWPLDTYAYLFLSLTHGQICPKTIPLGSRDTRCQYTFGHTVKFTLRTQFCK